MHRFLAPLLATGIIIAFYVVGSETGSRHVSARASTGPLVTIGSPLPVPVSGAVNVSNTPLPVSGMLSAQQSGAWNVGINGTPSVNIANSPTVNLAASGTPLLFRNIDDPGRIPYESTSDMTGACPSNSCVFTFVGAPAGHRLVVQHIFGKTWLNDITADAQVTLSSGNIEIEGFSIPVPSTRAFVVFDQPVLLYFDAGQGFSLTVTVGGSANFHPSFSLTASASGYLLDCAVTPCGAIAR